MLEDYRSLEGAATNLRAVVSILWRITDNHERAQYDDLCRLLDLSETAYKAVAAVAMHIRTTAKAITEGVEDRG